MNIITHLSGKHRFSKRWSLQKFVGIL